MVSKIDIPVKKLQSFCHNSLVFMSWGHQKCMFRLFSGMHGHYIVTIVGEQVESHITYA